MIIEIMPRTSYLALDIIIAEQAAYYGQINAHVVAYYLSKR